MPAYNEGWCIYENIRTTLAVLEEAGIPAEIVAVDDGSRDNTRDEIERAAGDFPNVVSTRNPYNMGKGMALRTGFERSTGELVVFLDADLDLHPSQVRRLVTVLEEGRYDIVVGSKHHPESKLDYPATRKIASWGYYLFIKGLFGLPVRDTQTGLKVFRRKVLEDIFHRLLVKKFAYDIELLAVAVRFGYRIREIPVVLDFKRQLRWGRIRLADVLHLFVDTLAIFYRLRILRYYDTERPPLPKERKDVLVVVIDGCPSEEVVERLTFDGVSRIACLRENGISEDRTDKSGHPVFTSRTSMANWIASQAGETEAVGFLSRDCLPIGSWVKSALRNFADPEVEAVCGPVIPGPLSGMGEKIAGMVFSSPYTRGADARLHSYKPVASVQKGLSCNLFLRTGLFVEDGLEAAGYSFGEEYFHDTSPRRNRMRYDPDVAVSRRIPPFPFPYLRIMAAKAFRDGCRVWQWRNPGCLFCAAAPLLIPLFLTAGWMYLPGGINWMPAAAYGLAVLSDGFSYFSPRLGLPVAVGIVMEHLVRALAFPAGMIAGLFGKGRMMRG